MRCEDFPDFYREVHGHEPFPWQKDLPRQIVEAGQWPSLVDVPTGLGKTSMLDVAVFLLALEADLPPAQRLARRRIFLVVDRRIVVDQAEEHARRIAERLDNAEIGSATALVAERLRRLSSSTAGQSVLPVVKMRGGATWDAAWLPRPDLPAIVTGTVDQVGSRLFFRGYGVSPRRRPIDAALVGADSLILVDESHLATALTASLASASAVDAPQHDLCPKPVITMLTATTDEEIDGWVPAFDTQAHLAEPVAARRITARKRLRMESTQKKTAAKRIAEVAVEALSPGARVLVVCNTIDRAREVFAHLSRSSESDVERLLLIGRSRSYEREAVVDRVLALFGAGRDESPASAVLVATQTVEVGIDLDATALVTESSSWDALVQRIGRVNRRGDRDDSVVVVVDDDDSRPPVYGNARLSTVEYLGGLLADSEELDVSPLALRRLSPPKGTMLERAAAPYLLPAHLDAWTRTSPAPVNDAPLDAYLHGIERGVAPVALAWRDGLLLADGSPAAADPSTWIEAIPVRGEESVEVPLVAVRLWLAGRRAAPLSDWDDDEWAPFAEDTSREVLRKEALPDGTVAWKWVTASLIRPGDSLVVPSEYGGLDDYGWNPASEVPVRDVAELAALDRGQAALRIDEALAGRLGLPPLSEDFWSLLRTWQTSDDPEVAATARESGEAALRRWLAVSAWPGAGPWARPVALGESRGSALLSAMSAAELQLASRGRRRDLPVLPARDSSVIIMKPTASGQVAAWREASDETPDGTTHIFERRVTLKQHGNAVAARAEGIARNLRLPDELVRAVADASQWHDLGKTDPRFQAMLFGGDRVSAELAEEPLAKSGMDAGDLQRRRGALRRSGLPRGARHEAWSQALVRDYLEKLATPYPADADLVLHLVASHHGHARPLLPAVVETAQHDISAEIDGAQVTVAVPQMVDLEDATRFQRLNARYGRWGLALLEAIVRCADMTVSGEGS